MKRILTRIKKIDIFGARVELRLDHLKQHKTYCGACMTLFILFITLVVSLIYMNQFLAYDNPFLRIYNIKLDDQEFFFDSSTENGAGLMVGLFDTVTGDQINDDSIVLVATLIHQDNYQNTDIIPLEQCDQNISMQCLPKNLNILMNSYNTVEFISKVNKFFQFSIYDCLSWQQIAKTNTQCKTPDEISMAIINTKVTFQFNQYQINPRDFLLPIKRLTRKYSKQITPSPSREDTLITFNIISFSTDKGAIWEDYQKLFHTSYTSHTEVATPQNSIALTTYKIILDENHIIYEVNIYLLIFQVKEWEGVGNVYLV